MLQLIFVFKSIKLSDFFKAKFSSFAFFVFVSWFWFFLFWFVLMPHEIANAGVIVEKTKLDKIIIFVFFIFNSLLLSV